MADTQADPTTQESTNLGGGDFVTEGVHVSLSLTDKGLSWTNLNDRKSVFLEWNEVIRCHRGLVSSKSPLVVPEAADKETCFTLHYCEKKPNQIWKHRYKIFHSSENNFVDILSNIKEKSTKDRPKRLLVVINPCGGRGTGEKLYSSVVAPLFKLAQIDTDVIVSKHGDHPDEIGETYDFSTVEGVVIVGGDGTLHKVLHTWLPRVQREKGVDINDPQATLQPLPCTFAVIPTGTGNGLARYNYGSADVTTAALNIIAGKKLQKKLLRVTNGGKHVGFAAVMLGSGAWGDMLDLVAEGRNQGFFRKQMTLIGALFKGRREFNLQVEYLPVETNKKSDDESTEKQEWVSVEGPHTGVNTFPDIYSSNRASGKFYTESEKPGVTLLLERQCGTFKYLRFIFQMNQQKNTALESDFIRVEAVRRYRYHVVHTETTPRSEREAHLEELINMDGELRRIHNIDTDIEVSYLPDVLEMYGTKDALK